MGTEFSKQYVCRPGCWACHNLGERDSSYQYGCNMEGPYIYVRKENGGHIKNGYLCSL